MRIIKFRGKDVKTSHWVYGAYHEHIDITPAALYKDAESRENHIKEHTHYLIMQDAFSDYCMPRNIQCFDVTSETVGQFSGLYDCNEKEIFEGDIVKWEKDGLMYVVKFWDGMFYASVKECNDGIFGGFPLHALTEYENEKCEIVGNIYDNTELLKGGDR